MTEGWGGACSSVPSVSGGFGCGSSGGDGSELGDLLERAKSLLTAEPPAVVVKSVPARAVKAIYLMAIRLRDDRESVSM